MLCAEPSIFAIYFWCWLSFYYLFLGARLISLSMSPRVFSPDCMRAHVREWEISDHRMPVRFMCQFSRFHFYLTVEHICTFITCRRERDTPILIHFIHRRPRHTIRKFYYCRAVGLITRLQFTAIAFDSHIFHSTLQAAVCLVHLSHSRAYTCWDVLQRECVSCCAIEWDNGLNVYIRKIIIKNNNGVH